MGRGASEAGGDRGGAAGSGAGGGEQLVGGGEIFIGGFGRQVIGAGAGGVGDSTTHLFTRFGINSLSGASGPIVYRRFVGPGI